MKIATLFSTTLLVGLLGIGTATAQTSSDKLASLSRIAEAVGLEEIITTKFIEGFMSNDDVTSSGLPEKTLLQLRDILVERFDMEDFLSEALLPIIDEHFTAAELSQMADVFESALGQKFVAAQMGGEEFDFMAMMQDESIDRAEAAKAMTLFMTLGPKLEQLGDGEIGQAVESSVRAYAEAYFIDVIVDIVDEAAD